MIVSEASNRTEKHPGFRELRKNGNLTPVICAATTRLRVL